MEYDDGLGHVGGATALHIACVEGNTDVDIKLLGVPGVDIDAQDDMVLPLSMMPLAGVILILSLFLLELGLILRYLNMMEKPQSMQQQAMATLKL